MLINKGIKTCKQMNVDVPTNYGVKLKECEKFFKKALT